MTHGVFPKESYNKFKPDAGGLFCCVASSVLARACAVLCRAPAALALTPPLHSPPPPKNPQQKTTTEGCAANLGFRYFWLSDSCPQTVSAVAGVAPFEVLSLAGPIADALLI